MHDSGLWVHLETPWCFVKVAEATRYLSSGLVQARPVALDTRLPVSYGPEERYRIPSAMCEIPPPQRPSFVKEGKDR